MVILITLTYFTLIYNHEPERQIMIPRSLIGCLMAANLSITPLMAMDDECDHMITSPPPWSSEYLETQWQYHLNQPAAFFEFAHKLINLKNSSPLFTFDFSSTFLESQKIPLTPLLISQHLKSVENNPEIQITCSGVYLDVSSGLWGFILTNMDGEDIDTLALKLSLPPEWQKKHPLPMETLLQQMNICPIRYDSINES